MALGPQNLLLTPAPPSQWIIMEGPQKGQPTPDFYRFMLNFLLLAGGSAPLTLTQLEALFLSMRRSMTDTGVAPGSYQNPTLTLNAEGRVIRASSGVGSSGSGVPGWDGEPGEDAWVIPGAQGPAGPAGATFTAIVPGWDGEDAEGWAMPGPAGPTGPSGAPTSGTWTPVLSFGGASVGITYTDQLGIYTQIGKLVFVSFSINLSNKGSSTGAAVIDGLPAAATAATHQYQIVPPFDTSETGRVWTGFIGIAGGVSNTQFAVYNSTFSSALTNTAFTNTTQMVGGFCYMTA